MLFGKFWSILLIGIFMILSQCYSYNKNKVLETLLAEEHRKYEQLQEKDNKASD